jgi:SAM-dependent methyltransferase
VFDLSRCTKCGHGWLPNAPAGARLEALYATYATDYWSDDPARHLLYRLVAAERARRILRARPAAASALDVGSGVPVLAQALHERGVDHVESLDQLPEALASEVRRHAPDVRHHSLRLDAFPTGRAFDVVAAFHVIEHVPEPREALARLCTLVAPGGVLALGLPTYEHPGVRLFGGSHAAFHVPYHLHFFNDEGLRILLDEQGFRIRTSRKDALFSAVNVAMSLLVRLGVRGMSRRRLPVEACIAGLLPFALAAELLTDLGGCRTITCSRHEDVPPSRESGERDG